MSTYSNLSVELIGIGEQDGTWGGTTNVNLGTSLQEALVGTTTIAVTTGDTAVTLGLSSNATTPGRNLQLNLTGTSGGSGTLTIPTVGGGGGAASFKKNYIINNASDTDITARAGASDAGVLIPGGTSSFVYSNGTNLTHANTYHTGAGVFTTLSASGLVSGAGFTARFATPGPIGDGTPSTGAFTTLNATGATTLDGDVTIGAGSGQSVTHNAGTVTIPNDLIYSGTGAITQPVGTELQRPSGVAGMFRYNSDSSEFEGYTDAWGSIGGGASAGGAVYENTQTITANYTMTTGTNGHSVGPITINTGITVTIPTGSSWLVSP